MHLSSLSGALYILEQYIAILKNDLLWMTYYFLIKLFVDFPKGTTKSLVTFVV